MFMKSQLVFREKQDLAMKIQHNTKVPARVCYISLSVYSPTHNCRWGGGGVGVDECFHFRIFGGGGVLINGRIVVFQGENHKP